MRHFIAGLLLTLGCASLDAALPLALLGKQIIQSIVQSLVEDAIHATLLATLGPCDGALASSALTNAQALLGSRGGMPSLPGGIPGLPQALPGGGAMPAMPAGMSGLPPGLAGGGATAGALGALAGAGALAGGLGGLPIGTLSALGGGGGSEQLPPQMREMMRKQLEEELRERRADQKKRGLTPEQIEAEDRRLAQEQSLQAEEIMAMLRDSQPLSAAELDEFVKQYEKLSRLAPDSAQCSPESLRRLLTPATAIPMAAAPIRTMLRSLREVDKEMAEARRTFAAMTPEDRVDFGRQMSEQIEDWSEENRQGFASLLRANPFGMPDALRDELLKKLN